MEILAHHSIGGIPCRMKEIMHFFRLASGLLAGVSILSAGSISLQNPSFEQFNPLDIACAGTGCAFNTAVIPGWVNAPGGTTGSWQPGNPQNTVYYDSLPDGITLAYSSGELLSQNAPVTVQLGVTYTLQVEIGRRKGSGQPGIAQLWIGGINQPGSTSITATGAAAPEGAFTTFTSTYVGIAADVGKTITIALRSSNLGGDLTLSA